MKDLVMQWTFHLSISAVVLSITLMGWVKIQQYWRITFKNEYSHEDALIARKDCKNCDCENHCKKG